MLTGQARGPAQLSRLGPITAGQAIPLARLAALDPHTSWRVILTNAAGHAIGVERVYRRAQGQATEAGQRGCPSGITGRVTVTIPSSALSQTGAISENPGLVQNPALGRAGVLSQYAALVQHPGLSQNATLSQSTPFGRAPTSDGPDNTQVPGIDAAILRAASRAAARAEQVDAANAATPGDCAHASASASYRPPPRLREFIEVRDQTCRQPRCRQPARQADLDHTIPFDQGGKTCACNLGPECRTHHQIKQESGWNLTQPRAGYFELTTPAGRTYTTEPDAYPA